ncbi:hypothetical protein HQ544_03790 [Candidatus Falkowbacteria bacterium]|nr:hypothetical protein [Candidatus Falkowbacteria bacterium]
MSDLERTILTLITYYDIFDYPLSLIEVWLWGYKLDARCKVLDVVELLQRLADKIEEKDGFYFLRGREELVSLRQERRNFGVEKWKKSLGVVKILRFVPFVRMIALCNNNGFLHTKKDSDIDLFIIVSGGRLWLARFLITLVTQIMGVRRYGRKIDNRICLSFYITDEALNIKKFYDKNNMYLYQWMNLIAPIFDVDKTYRRFFLENEWIKIFLPKAREWWIPESGVIRDSEWSRKARRFFEIFFSGWAGSPFLRKIQLKRMMRNKDSAIHEDNDKVVVNDRVMKFHERALPEYRPDSFI